MARSGTGPPLQASPPSTCLGSKMRQHRSRPAHLIRPDAGRQDQGVGLQPCRPVRTGLHHAHHPRRRGGTVNATKSPPTRPRVRPAESRRHDQVLGLERRRPGRGRVIHRRTTPSPVAITKDRRVRGMRNHVRRAAGRRDQVLGYKLRWDDGSIAGQLGDGTVTAQRNTPVDVVGIATATSVALGYWHACALLNGGAVKCWGANDHGQLGDGTNTSSNVPTTSSTSRRRRASRWASRTRGARYPTARSHGQRLPRRRDGDGGNVPVDVPGIITRSASSSGKAKTRASCCPATTRSSAGARTVPDGSGTGPSDAPRARQRAGPPCDASAAPVNGAVGDCTNSLRAGRRASPRARRGTRCPGGARATPSAFCRRRRALRVRATRLPLPPTAASVTARTR